MRFQSCGVAIMGIAGLLALEAQAGTSRRRKVSKVAEDVMDASREDQCVRCTEILEGLRPQDGEPGMCVRLLPEPTGSDDPNDENLSTANLTSDGDGEDAAILKRRRNNFRHMARDYYRSVRKAAAGGSAEKDLTPGQVAGIRSVYVRIADKNDIKYEIERAAAPPAEGAEAEDSGDAVVKDAEAGIAEAQDAAMEQVTGEPVPDAEPAQAAPEVTGDEQAEAAEGTAGAEDATPEEPAAPEEAAAPEEDAAPVEDGAPAEEAEGADMGDA